MSECACEKCVACCGKTPGWFAPGQAEKTAEAYGIPWETFQKVLIKDSCSNWKVGDAPWIWSPRKESDSDLLEHRNAHSQREKARCIFLKEGRCGIHKAKPRECAETYGCKGTFRYRDTLEQEWVDAGAPLGYRPDPPRDD